MELAPATRLDRTAETFCEHGFAMGSMSYVGELVDQCLHVRREQLGPQCQCVSSRSFAGKRRSEHCKPADSAPIDEQSSLDGRSWTRAHAITGMWRGQ